MTFCADGGPLMFTGLLKVAKRAYDHPDAQFHSLAHLLDEAALRRAYDRIRPDAAVGIDGITKEQYGQQLEENLRGLHERLRSKRYRHQPIRRVHIEKAPGKTRPIGISCVEDKIVQGALCEVMEAIYERDFLDCSFGFRPRRSAHDALRAVDHMAYREGITVILELDIQAYFDSIVRTKLVEMLQRRVADPSFLRLVSKCLHVGVLDGAEFTRPDEGTVQGSSLSPMLGNVYLHYVLDLWFQRDVQPHLKGHARLIRYADDAVLGFTRRDDAERVLALLRERLAEYGLTLHPDKTRLIPFARPQPGPRRTAGPRSFDLLGFTVYWQQTRRGGWRLAMKTRKARLRKTIQAFGDWCRRHRHLPLQEQRAALVRRLRGHYQYFGVNGNIRSLRQVHRGVARLWFKWLRRRSHRGYRLTRKRFLAYLQAYPLPQAQIRVRLWGEVKAS